MIHNLTIHSELSPVRTRPSLSSGVSSPTSYKRERRVF